MGAVPGYTALSPNIRDRLDGFFAGLAAPNGYAEKPAVDALRATADGEYRFTDYMDDDGQGNPYVRCMRRTEI